MILRKIAAGVLAFFLVAAALSGCAGGVAVKPDVNPSEQLGKPFESTVSIRYHGMEATAHLVRQAPGCSRLSFQSPKALEGLSVEITTDRVDIGYSGLHTSLAPGLLPESAIPELIAGVINAAGRETGVTADSKNGVLTLSGQTESGTYELRLDAKSGNILSLSVPAAKLEAVFQDFNYLSGQQAQPLQSQDKTE